MRKELTDIFLRGLKPPATGRLEINDTSCRNLQLRLTATGVATWSLRYTVGNKVKRTNLGHYPVMTLKQARARANEQRGKIDAGEDPQTSEGEGRAHRPADASPIWPAATSTNIPGGTIAPRASKRTGATLKSTSCRSGAICRSPTSSGRS